MCANNIAIYTLPQQAAQLVLDSTHLAMVDLLPLQQSQIHILEKETRLLCYIQPPDPPTEQEP